MEDGVALGGGEGEALGDDGVLAGTAGNLQGSAEIYSECGPPALVLVTAPTVIDRSSVASAVTSWDTRRQCTVILRSRPSYPFLHEVFVSG